MDKTLPICIIEDSAPIRKLFSALLKKSGYQVIDFEDAFSSLEWLKENKTMGIIMDILLPDMNGTELLKKVKEVPEHKNTPVIAVTGFATANDKERFTSIGFNSYIAKPVVTATFVDDVLNGFQENN